MKQLSLLSKNLVLMIAVVVLALPAHADRTVNQLQFGKQTIEVAADEVITFLDMNGYQGISSSSSNNSQSLTVFKPAQGMAIQLTFERLDVRNDGASWPAYVNVYAGDPDADNSFSYATSTSGVTGSSTLPTGNVLEKLDGTYAEHSVIAIPGEHNGWSTADDAMTAMGKRDNTENHEWMSEIISFDGGKFKFAADNSWDVNWGGTDFPLGIGTQGGPDIVSKPGSYKVYFNDILGLYYFLAIE